MREPKEKERQMKMNKPVVEMDEFPPERKSKVN